MAAERVEAMKLPASCAACALLCLLLAVSAGTQAGPTQSSNPATIATTLVYQNTQYGFCFLLPASWKGYSIVAEHWRGTDFSAGNQVVHGPQLRIRHPGWTQENPYEDIPIMVFTPEQWQQVEKVTMSVSAAPIGPEKLGQNSNYVFALPPRYNFDFATGWQEVQQLIDQHSLQAPCGNSAAPPANGASH
jgi:hypothetical protein